MPDKSYFLELEYLPNSQFNQLTKVENVKIVVPSYVFEKFQRLHTENRLILGAASPTASQEHLAQIYDGYEVLFLNISEILENGSVSFVLEQKPDIVAAFVCIPPDCKYSGYSKSTRQKISDIIEEYYNRYNFWCMRVVADRCEILNQTDDCLVDQHNFYEICEHKFSMEDEEFFEKCKTKYNITNREIIRAKKLMTMYRESITGTSYVIDKYVKKGEN